MRLNKYINMIIKKNVYAIATLGYHAALITFNNKGFRTKTSNKWNEKKKLLYDNPTIAVSP